MAKILVIDDEPDLLEMLRLVLEHRAGHEVVLSADGEEGLAQAVANPPDLAIIDVMMPGITGYEICRQLRANPSTGSISIIILTARAQPVDQQAALQAGADDYIAKPVMMTELIERVNALLAKREAGKPAVFAGTVALMSLRGGVGVTTLAVNLAAMLAQAQRGQGQAVCLVDLCPSSGHVALQLGLRPEPNWSGLIQASDVDAWVIEQHLLHHASGLRVLASPIFPIVGQGVPQTTVKTMFQVLQQRFPVIVVDTPSVLNDMTMAALEAASVVELIVTAEPPSIQTTVGTLRVLKQRLAHSAPGIQIVLNQTAPGLPAPTEAIERTLRLPLAATMPFDPAQARALAQRAPLAFTSPADSDSPSPLALAVQEWTRELARAAHTSVASHHP